MRGLLWVTPDTDVIAQRRLRPTGPRTPRQPLLVVSPFAKRNHIGYTLTDQASVLRFIEDNWLSGERIQMGGSFDTIAGSIEHMFNFNRDRQ